MIQYLLRNSEFSNLVKLLSPAALKIFDNRKLLQMVAQVTAQSLKEREWNLLKIRINEILVSRKVEVKFQAPSDIVDLSAERSQQNGHEILKLFFTLINSDCEWILDFRAKTFSAQTNKVIWNPKKIWYSPSLKFRQGIQRLYRGFYLDEASQFSLGATELGLTSVENQLRAHFGKGDQTKVQFQFQNFQKTFIDIFESCTRQKTQLPEEFLVLGLMLLGLYESLDTSSKENSANLEYDVRSCFMSTLK